MKEQGPSIKIEIADHTYSERPADGGFDYLRQKIEEMGSSLSGVLGELARSEEKQKIILATLEKRGLNWASLVSSPENQEALLAFGRLLAHWETPLDGKPKTAEDHQREVLEFAKLLE